MADWLHRRRHLTLETLLLLTNDELAPTVRQAAETHLDRCARCRAVRENVSTLLHDLAQDVADGTLTVDLAVTSHVAWSGWPRRRWLPWATAVVAAVGVVLALSRQSVVEAEADALVARHAAYEHTRPAGVDQRVRVDLALDPGADVTALAQALIRADAPRARPGLVHPPAIALTPFSTEWTLRDGQRVDEDPRAEALATLAWLFEVSRLDLRRPLSGARIHAWRTALTTKRDDLRTRGDRSVLRTTTTEGLVRELELTVRGSHIVRVTIVFAGVGRFACQEMPPDVRPASAPGISASLQPSRAERTFGPAGASAGPVRLALPPWLDHQLTQASADARARFIPSLLDRLATVQAHVTTLHQLAARPPALQSSQARATARRRWAQQSEALRAALRAVAEQLAVVVTVSPQCEPAFDAPADWRRRTAAALADVATLDARLRAVLGRDQPPRPEDAQTIRTSFAALWRVMACADDRAPEERQP